MVLRGIHDAKTVDGLIARLGKTTDRTQREGLLTALCRLHSIEGNWKKDSKGIGESWGTRPDTRGPFYQPEEWAETKKIAEVLKAAINAAGNEEATFLAKEFSRHRIKMNDATTKLIALAAKDPSLLPILAKQLAEADSIPTEAIPLLMKASGSDDDATATAAAIALCKVDNRDATYAILGTLARLGGKKKDFAKLRNAFFNSRLIENQHQALEQSAPMLDGTLSVWADAALLNLAARKVGSPEPREMAAKSLEAGWADVKRREQIIRAAVLAEDKSLAEKIVAAQTDADPAVAKSAQDAVKKLKIDPAKMAAKQTGPMISSLKAADVVEQVMKTKGDRARGEGLFTSTGCVACHTVKATDPVKGPYLGNIAETYKRRELAEAILMPNKTIAQGFVTNLFTMKDGAVQMGFVTQEAADKVVIRNIAAQEITLDPKNIAKREKNDQSLMPEGLVNALTVNDLASLIDYLESLAKK
jgi:putative heme-binding domain-containing protein